jgi:hypothetical protein
MFSFFDHLRRRTCDSVLAGMYDAFELIETRNAEEQTRTADLLLVKFDGEAEPKPPAPVPVSAPRPAPTVTQRPSLPSPTPPTLPAPTTGGESLQPRKRGRPPKNPEGQQ